jgi:hypothetical protein
MILITQLGKYSLPALTPESLRSSCDARLGGLIARTKRKSSAPLKYYSASELALLGRMFTMAIKEWDRV